MSEASANEADDYHPTSRSDDSLEDVLVQEEEDHGNFPKNHPQVNHDPTMLPATRRSSDDGDNEEGLTAEPTMTGSFSSCPHDAASSHHYMLSSLPNIDYVKDKVDVEKDSTFLEEEEHADDKDKPVVVGANGITDLDGLEADDLEDYEEEDDYFEDEEDDYDVDDDIYSQTYHRLVKHWGIDRIHSVFTTRTSVPCKQLLEHMVRHDYDNVKGTVQRQPNVLNEMIDDMFLPLHVAFVGWTDLSMIQLVASQPTKRSPDCNGSTPLHLAYEKGATSPEIMEYLLHECVASLLIQDPKGSLPLRLACQNPDCPPELVKQIWKAHPSAVKVLNHSYESPIHALARRSNGLLQGWSRMAATDPLLASCIVHCASTTSKSMRHR